VRGRVPTCPCGRNASLLSVEQLSKGRFVGREEQPILVRRLLRSHNVQQARDGHVHALGDERSARLPHRLEIEAGHDERQAHFQVVRTGDSQEGVSFDHTPREFLVPRPVQRLAAGPERQVQRLACTPSLKQVARVRRKEQITIASQERRGSSRRVIVGALDSDHDKADVPLVEIRMTSDAARFLGIEDRTGRAAAGLEADLLIVRGAPDRDIRNVRNVALVTQGSPARRRRSECRAARR